MRDRIKKRFRKYRRNFKEVRIYILIKIFALIGISCVFSAGYTFLGMMGKRRPEILLFFILAFLVLDIIFMRRCYYHFAHLRKYIMAEGIPHVVYALCSILVAKLLPDNAICYIMFGISNIFEFAIYNISPFISAVVFNAILLLAVRLVPLSMKWLHISHG